MSELDMQTLQPLLAEFLKRESTKLYIYTIKNLRMFVIVAFTLFIIGSSAFAGLALVIAGLISRTGGGRDQLAEVALILGSIDIVIVVGLFILASSQRFWLRTFRIDQLVERILEKS